MQISSVECMAQKSGQCRLEASIRRRCGGCAHGWQRITISFSEWYMVWARWQINDQTSFCDTVPRLYDDVNALLLFFPPTTPVQIIARPVQGSCLVAYGGGDASGEGFGGQIQPLDRIRCGFWCPAKSDESSNWRELRNLIDLLQLEAASGRLTGKEVWLATDNTTAAFAFHNGTSSSRMLHDMVVGLRMLTLRGNFLLHLYHIAGTRMIESGIDGLSRGELHVDSLDRAIPIIMPLHLLPIQRSPSLNNWLSTWLDSTYRIAQPADWFHGAQHCMEFTSPPQSSTWVWDLPPAAAIHALEELGFGRLKRHNHMRGVVLIPQLLSHEWFCRFTLIVDFYFRIPPGSIPEWPENMHEPLTVGFYLPLFRHEPWDWKQVPFVASFRSAMSSMHKAWRNSLRVTSMPKGVVRNLLQSRSWRKFLNLQTDWRQKWGTTCTRRRDGLLASPWRGPSLLSLRVRFLCFLSLARWDT